MDRVKTFDDALALAGEKDREEYLKSVEGFSTPDELAYKKLKLITKVINEGWVADFFDYNQEKWVLWGGYLNRGASSGLLSAYFYSTSGNASAYIGSRLNFESKEKASYVGNQFKELWLDFIL